VGRSHGVIRWADYALENKQQWSGTTYKKNVYALYKLRAQAANKLWQSAEAKYVEDRSDTNEVKAKKYRDLTKNYGREWLDYARASGQSTKSPLSLCVSAAGSTDFCEG
jgi:thymidylate synthase